MPRPEPIHGGVIDPRHGGTDGAIRRPVVGPDRRPIPQRPHEDRFRRQLPPSRDHIGIIGRPGMVNNLVGIQRGWNSRDHGYYWHDWDGHRVCHHYDNFRFHWWGFYVGDVYFWTRYWNDSYWWYDPYWHRWVYLRGDNWWWQDPARLDVVYIYRDGSYFRYEEGRGGVIVAPDTTPPVTPPPAEPAPAPSPDEKGYYSADGTRAVQVYGEAKDAFLYDTAETPAFEPKWLARDVKEVRFRLDDAGALVQILVLTGDDAFSLFDKDGNSIESAPAKEPVAAPGEPGQEGATPAAGGSLGDSASFGALRSGAIGW